MNKLGQATWQATVFACALVVLVGSVAVTAIIRYNVEDALKVWVAMDTLTGVIVGAVVSYFFAQKAIKAEKMRADTLEALARKNNLL